MKPMFEIGQKVMIRPDLVCGGQFNMYFVNNNMLKLAGTIVEITDCQQTLYPPQSGIIDGYRYEIAEDLAVSSYHYNWTADCFVKVEYDIDIFSLLEFL